MAALECWTSRSSTATDDDTVEHVLMRTHDRSEAFNPHDASQPFPSSSNPIKDLVQKKFHRFSRNFTEALSTLKTTLNLDPGNIDKVRDPDSRKALWGGVVKNLTQLYPGSQLPEKLISTIRRHFDSLPLSYANAGFEIREVFSHVKLIEQASASDRPAVSVQEVQDSSEFNTGTLFNLTFASMSPISWPAMAGALDSASTCCKRVQIFEKKGCTLGVVLVLVQPGHERGFRAKVDGALKAGSIAKRGTKAGAMKLALGLCGCQGELTRAREPEPSRPWLVARFDELARWVIDPDELELVKSGPDGFEGLFRGRRVRARMVRGCGEKLEIFAEIEIRRDVLEVMGSGKRGLVQFYGLCMVEKQGLCIVTRLMEGGYVQERKGRVEVREVVRIAADVAEGLRFMHESGVVYRDLNTGCVLLDGEGNAGLAGFEAVRRCCGGGGEVTEYETSGFRWLAPEIIAGDPESVEETTMSNVYSFGMVVWEMLTGETAYASYSPVQAAVGIATNGLRPQIPASCPAVLQSLLNSCWNVHPSQRPTLPQIASILSDFENSYSLSYSSSSGDS
ncbi:hypothetical protein AMTRI_Chr08g208080 [Amborella trichopoda]|uniref:Protein kinase domain-containing protein n=1 Tax=Amborella trichopoda TaxID=13333 RepID=W1PLR6_AMBTC|nr:dual specificity testis-specific protein kinase 2 [Amborella trichopoda]ERN08993.1 hypothetical protein AMTR_s00153p00057910 [Amborella trichopoda]|eukprot:XP_006847412.1 dual specificity testis-specific protein kinase 2 [Amborella trichopoda]